MFTERGRQRLEELAAALAGVWSGPRRREEWVDKALRALHCFVRDQHYLVRNGRVEIIDQPTGRAAPDRSWEQGLHQLIEIKEGCDLTPERETLARISYQQFFRRYLRLSGMTGTAREVARELWSVYRLNTLVIRPRLPVRRRSWGSRVFPTQESKWQAVVARVRQLQKLGRPVLVGTCSLAASEQLSARLTAAGFPHRVLNARQDANEAAIVAEAGRRGRITVATNMAGRGTDIGLGPGVTENGGLHVIATQRAEARRIDRQLFGRCGRQGDPGSYEEILSLEDEPVKLFYPAGIRSFLTRRIEAGGALRGRMRKNPHTRSAMGRRAQIRPCARRPDGAGGVPERPPRLLGTGRIGARDAEPRGDRTWLGRAGCWTGCGGRRRGSSPRWASQRAACCWSRSG